MVLGLKVNMQAESSVIVNKAVEELDFFRPYGRIGGLEYDRHSIEAWIIDKALEEIHSKSTLTYLRMSVYPGSEFAKIVIEMEGPKVIPADYAVEFLPGSSITFHICKIISCGIGMTRINANTDPLLVFDLVDDVSQLFESVS